MNEFLEFLKTFQGKGAALTPQEADLVAVALRGHAVTKPLFQLVFDRGHGAATEENKRKEKEFTDRIATAERERDAANTKLKDLEGKTPDVQRVRDELQGEVNKLNDSIKELKDQHKAQRVSWYREREQGKLKDRLISLGVDPDWAGVMVKDEAVMQRLKVTESEDGKGITEVLKAGSDNISLQGDDPLGLLAAELRKDVKANFLTSKADAGSDTRDGGSGGGGGKSVFDKAREAGKQAHAGTRPEGFRSGSERLGAVGGGR